MADKQTLSVLETIASNTGTLDPTTRNRSQLEVLEIIAKNTESGGGGEGSMTAAQIKTAYESNPNTNAYVDADKTKLAGITEGAQPNSVTSVAGRTGAVVVTKTDVTLGNVDNTADTAKPVSVAQQAALDLKANLTNANFTGAVSVAGNLTTNTSLISQRTASGAAVILDSPAATQRLMYLRTAGSDRWRIGANSDAEAGSNAGSSFILTRYSDAAAGLGTSINVSRATGEAVLEQLSVLKPVKVGTYTLTTLPSAAAYTNYLIMVSNATGGAKLCYSNGTNWCPINTTTAVS